MSQAKLRRKKRSKYEIIHDILDQCQTGSKKTWVMYRANLSYDLTTNYLNELEKLGLVENKDGLYYITEKGKQLLELLKAWRQKMAELNEVTKKIRESLPENGRKAKEVKAEVQNASQQVTAQPAQVQPQVPPPPQVSQISSTS